MEVSAVHRSGCFVKDGHPWTRGARKALGGKSDDDWELIESIRFGLCCAPLDGLRGFPSYKLSQHGASSVEVAFLQSAVHLTTHYHLEAGKVLAQI